MTNKEAIEILKPLFEQCKGTNECLGYIEHYFSKDEELALDLAIHALEERPQGEWIRLSERLYKCKNCGYIADAKYPFCHCGADMRGKEE